MSIITRFAPSPTGYLHIGGARTALFNYLFAKHLGGKFLLRIEDTDLNRSTNEAVDAILQGLKWLNLNHDDEIIFQSKNISRHKEVANKLLEDEKAYLCYVSKEELDEMRKKSEDKKEVFRFQSPWRDKINSQSSNVKPVIRLKTPLEGETIIQDLVQGEVRVKNLEIDDLILLRSDQTPTYMLAVVVDDFDMKISHIIRGDDHLNNTFKQKIIYEAMNWQVPKFAHIPLIHGNDGAKMSKRHGATSVIDYKDFGYLPDAMRNYLLRLGWSYGNEEIISDEEAIKLFDIKNVGKSPSRFDFAKLNNVNKFYIKQKSDEELFDLIIGFLPKKPSNDEKLRIIKALKFLKEKPNTLKEIADSAKAYFDDFCQEIDENSAKILKEKQNLLLKLKEILQNLSIWNHDSIKEALNDYATKNNIKIKDFGPALRISLTFSPSSAGGIFDVVEFLGKKEVLRRL